MVIKSDTVNCEKAKNGYKCYSNKDYNEVNGITILTNDKGNYDISYSILNSNNVVNGKIENGKYVIPKNTINLKEDGFETIVFNIKNGSSDIVGTLNVEFIYDTTNPVCTFIPTYQYVKINKKLIGYESTASYVTLECKDENAIKNINKITKENISTTNATTLKSISLLKDNYDVIYENDNKIQSKISFKALRPTNSNNSTINYISGIKDKAGNIALRASTKIEVGTK